MNARSITRVRTLWSAGAQVGVRPPPLRLRRDDLVAVDPKLGAAQTKPAECGAALTREEKRILARDAAVLSALAMAALALVLLILERAYA
jgi:hypothetical protein